MDTFWRALARNPALSLPRAHAVERWGAGTVDRLVALGLLVATPIRQGDPYPCRQHAAPGCAMRVLGDVAACRLAPAQCLDERIDPVGMLVVDPRRLATLFARAMKLEASPGSPFLGRRVLGGRPASFLWVPCPSTVLGASFLGLLNEVPDPDLVLVTAHPARIPPTPRTIAGVNVAWITLADHLHLDGEGPLMDLLPAIERFGGTPEPADYWPRYALFIDEDKGLFLYGGRPLGIEKSPRLIRLLCALAAKPGEWVRKPELVRAIWPEERSKLTGNLTASQEVVLEKRLKDLKSEVAKAIRTCASCNLSLPPDPIGTREADPARPGAYAILPRAVVSMSSTSSSSQGMSRSNRTG